MLQHAGVAKHTLMDVVGSSGEVKLHEILAGKWGMGHTCQRAPAQHDQQAASQANRLAA